MKNNRKTLANSIASILELFFFTTEKLRKLLSESIS